MLPNDLADSKQELRVFLDMRGFSTVRPFTRMLYGSSTRFDDPVRTFLLIYSRRSTGWSGYAALQTTEVGARVRVCAVDQPHLLVPAVAHLRDALIDPMSWDNGTCH